jgi:hypothetical protein
LSEVISDSVTAQIQSELREQRVTREKLAALVGAHQTLMVNMGIWLRGTDYSPQWINTPAGRDVETRIHNAIEDYISALRQAWTMRAEPLKRIGSK